MLEEKTKYYYYTITNSVNNKKYCGITKNPTSRKQKHGRELKNGCHHSIRLQNAVNKYGLENFYFHIEEEKEFSNTNDAYLYEEKFIADNKSYLNGYNMTPGGLGSLGELSSQRTKESGGKRVDNVYQIDKDTLEIINVFPSLREVERQLGYAHSNIGRVCNRTDISAYGYYGCFSKDGKNNWIPPLNGKYKPIALLDIESEEIVRVFQSCADAARKLGLDRTNIRTAILRNGTCNKKKFCYITLEQYESYACRD